MAERKPYTTKTRQVILEYMKEQSEVTVSVADIEQYLKEMGIKVNTTTVYRYLNKLCAEHVVIKYRDHGFRLQCSGDMLHGICKDCENKSDQL